MGGWQFIPWTLQYLLGGILAFLISLYVLSKNPKSWAYRFFSFYGSFVSLWGFTAFFHRNAPTAGMSAEFFALDTFFGSAVMAFLLITLLTFRRERLLNLLVLAPAFILGILGAIFKPFDIFWTNFGWNYRYTSPEYLNLVVLMGMGYIVSILIVGWLLLKNSKTTVQRKKYSLILYGYLFLYAIGFSASNTLITCYPNSAPLGGVFAAATFLVVAAALCLPSEKIEKKLISGKKLVAEKKKLRAIHPFEIIMHVIQKRHLSDSLKKFVGELLNATPGKELGQSLPEFNRFLRYTGLNKVVSFRKGKILFENDVSSLNLPKSMEKTLEYVKNRKWTIRVTGSLGDLFVDTYRIIRTISKPAADEWVSLMIRKHGGFLSTHGILDKLPADAEIK